MRSCLAEVETSSTTQAATFRILSETGFDASEAAHSLWRKMDALTALRATPCWLQMLAPTSDHGLEAGSEDENYLNHAGS